MPAGDGLTCERGHPRRAEPGANVKVVHLLSDNKQKRLARKAEKPILVLSPHYDDAVLSCGAWLSSHPGSVVATVCTGRPGPGIGPHQWDGTSGFPSGDAAAMVRQGEDAAALAVL